MKMLKATLSVSLIAAVLCAAGCENKVDSKVSKKDEKHDEPEFGPHNGPIAEWDKDKDETHAEFTVDRKAKKATVYVLDDKIKLAKPIAVKELALTLKTDPPLTLTLKADPEKTDPAGTCSRFVATHDAFGSDKPFAGTISADSLKYSGDFHEKGAEEIGRKK